jgi:serine/threonine-protein kinase HipA
MRKAFVFMHNEPAGILTEAALGKNYLFEYLPAYKGPPISLTMPTAQSKYQFSEFPPFFDGLLPEGFQLEALLRLAKLDRHDDFGILVTVGQDTIGAVTVKEIKS